MRKGIRYGEGNVRMNLRSSPSLCFRLNLFSIQWHSLMALWTKIFSKAFIAICHWQLLTVGTSLMLWIIHQEVVPENDKHLGSGNVTSTWRPQTPMYAVYNDVHGTDFITGLFIKGWYFILWVMTHIKIIVIIYFYSNLVLYVRHIYISQFV